MKHSVKRWTLHSSSLTLHCFHTIITIHAHTHSTLTQIYRYKRMPYTPHSSKATAVRLTDYLLRNRTKPGDHGRLCSLPPLTGLNTSSQACIWCRKFKNIFSIMSGKYFIKDCTFLLTELHSSSFVFLISSRHCILKYY